MSDSLSYRKDFVPILISMGLKEPKIALPTLLSKIKRKTAKAEKTGDWMQLCVEMTDLTGQKKDIVGPTCEIKGITPQWLEQGTPITESISNHIIAELFQYRLLYPLVL
jgi:hypothetical protein